MNTVVHSSPPGMFKTNIPGGSSGKLQEQKNEYLLFMLRLLGYSKQISQEEDPLESSRNKRMNIFVHASPPGIFKTNIPGGGSFGKLRNKRMHTFVHSSPPGIFKANIPGGGSFRNSRNQKNESLCSFFASWEIQNEYHRRRILWKAPGTKNECLCSFFASWDIQNEYPRRRIL